VHVVYSAGWGRSGSTPLAALLSALRGVVAIGEARSFWSYSLLPRWLCSCGRPLAECARWAPLTTPGWPMTAAEVADYQGAHLRTRHYVSTALRLRFGNPSQRERRYVATYAELYGRIAALSGASTIVDSSKYPLDAYLLGTCTQIDLRVIHLVRDPRAVAYSWATPKRLSPEPGSPLMRMFSPTSSSAIWSTWNLVVERLVARVAPVLRVRYEDLVARPGPTLAKIASFADIAGEGSLDPSMLSLDSSHMLAGNPVRFAPGNQVLADDVRWRSAMNRRQRLAATLPALSALHRYGYSLWR